MLNPTRLYRFRRRRVLKQASDDEGQREGDGDLSARR
jgi:hypothetical protein